MRTRLQSPATWMQKLRAFFEALRLDDIAFCELERLNHQEKVQVPPWPPFLIICGSIAVFVGKRAVEKAAAWKVQRQDFPLRLEIRQTRPDFHFYHRPDYGGLTFPIFSQPEK